MAFFPNDDPEMPDRMRQLIGPGHVDEQIRQAVQFAWMSLPQERKTVAEVERVIRQIVERALQELSRRCGEFWARRMTSSSGASQSTGRNSCQISPRQTPGATGFESAGKR